jgi:hypothetical protein
LSHYGRAGLNIRPIICLAKSTESIFAPWKWANFLDTGQICRQVSPPAKTILSIEERETVPELGRMDRIKWFLPLFRHIVSTSSGLVAGHGGGAVRALQNPALRSGKKI